MLRKRREKLGISLGQMAEKIGWSKSKLSQIERGIFEAKNINSSVNYYELMLEKLEKQV
tara:strand:- start:492 stop:668 length:177 start_codon:yes stop_codon:yes gene_type:complete